MGLDTKDVGKCLGSSHVCMYIYIYVCMCVCCEVIRVASLALSGVIREAK